MANRELFVKKALKSVGKHRWFKGNAETFDMSTPLPIYQPPGSPRKRPTDEFTFKKTRKFESKNPRTYRFDRTSQGRIKRDFIAAFYPQQTPDRRALMRLQRGYAAMNCDQFVHLMLHFSRNLSDTQMVQIAKSPANLMTHIIAALEHSKQLVPIIDEETIKEIENGDLVIKFNPSPTRHWSHISIYNNQQLISLNDTKTGAVYTNMLQLDPNPHTADMYVNLDKYLEVLTKHIASIPVAEHELEIFRSDDSQYVSSSDEESQPTAEHSASGLPFVVTKNSFPIKFPLTTEDNGLYNIDQIREYISNQLPPNWPASTAWPYPRLIYVDEIGKYVSVSEDRLVMVDEKLIGHLYGNYILNFNPEFEGFKFPFKYLGCPIKAILTADQAGTPTWVGTWNAQGS